MPEKKKKEEMKVYSFNWYIRCRTVETFKSGYSLWTNTRHVSL